MQSGHRDSSGGHLPTRYIELPYVPLLVSFYICLTSFPLPSGLSASHSSRRTAYSVSVIKMSKAKFHTSVMA